MTKRPSPLATGLSAALTFRRLAGVLWLGLLLSTFPAWVAFGPLFADASYHDYFYGVAPQYASAARPAYDGHGGYSGSRLTLITGKTFDQFWLSAFVRLDTLKGAAFADSPLVERRSYHIVGVALTWIFARSETMVHVP